MTRWTNITRTITRRAIATSLLLMVGSITTAAHAERQKSSEYSSQTFAIDGMQRSYLLRTPNHGKPPIAIVVMLHGHTGSAEQLTGSTGKPAPYRQWNAIADREGLLLIAPQGINGGDNKAGWNDCRADASTNPASDDVRFIASLITQVQQRYHVSSSRVYAIGSSNGGQMALRLAIERPQLITATTAIVAAMPAHSECIAPKQAKPILFINGTEDPLMPFTGGRVGGGRDARGEVLSSASSVAIWAQLAGALPAPRVEHLPDLVRNDDSTVVRETYAQHNGKPFVVLDRIEGGGHLEPSAAERYPRFIHALLGKQNGDIEMAEEAWAFFKAQMP